MDIELKNIEKQIEDFCKKYNCAIEINTLTSGRDAQGQLSIIKICSKIMN